METKHIIMLAAVLVLVLMPLVLVPDAEYGGADGAAEDLISETGYEPWFESIWEPPSGEIESLLFVSQAAIGAIIIGYFIGYEKGKRAPRDDTD
ncbi:MAG: energy-coupling factor ABC transporter substrate-binding protein [Candidatus Bathyarchaeota archaeon]|nr:energy-coupling factor ABC transporter substrate-binding protein [Candidatus Bathyarchaeota archaeon]